MRSPNDKFFIAAAAKLIGHSNPVTVYRWIQLGVLPRREDDGRQFLYRRDLSKLVRAAANAPPVMLSPARAREILATGEL
jgi:hypothetical protein